jgi:hypothetical protein
MPNRVHAIDSQYHHLTNDVITRPFTYEDGQMAPPDSPGLGVELAEQNMERYVEECRLLRSGALEGHANEDYFLSPTDPRKTRLVHDRTELVG